MGANEIESGGQKQLVVASLRREFVQAAGMVLCVGRPRPGVECATAGARPLGGLLAPIAALVSGERARAKSTGAVPGRRERTLVKRADAYIAARLAGRNEEVLGLLSDNVKLTSSRDGVFAGKLDFRKYLLRVPPTGVWQRAFWNFERERAEVRGKVKVLVLPIDIVARFGFDRRGRINDIYVGTKK